MGVFLGFTAASWLIVPRVVEISAKRKKSSMCSYNSNTAIGKVPEILGSTASNALLKNQDSPMSSQEGSEEEEESVYKAANGSGDGGGPISRPKHFLYVGVMTAKKYLDSRAVAAHRTWTRSIPGKVEFFSSESSESVPMPMPIPVVSLTGVDDSYPPQKKSFMMLKYMHDHYLDKYEWFMRADDDVYIRGECPYRPVLKSYIGLLNIVLGLFKYCESSILSMFPTSQYYVCYN